MYIYMYSYFFYLKKLGCLGTRLTCTISKTHNISLKVSPSVLDSTSLSLFVSWEAVEIKGNHRAMFTEEPSA